MNRTRLNVKKTRAKTNMTHPMTKRCPMPISGNVEAQHGAHGAHDHAIQPSPLEQALASCSSVSADNGVGRADVLGSGDSNASDDGNANNDVRKPKRQRLRRRLLNGALCHGQGMPKHILGRSELICLWSRQMAAADSNFIRQRCLRNK